MSKNKVNEAGQDTNEKENCGAQSCGCTGDCHEGHGEQESHEGHCCHEKVEEENGEVCGENKNCGGGCGGHHQGGGHHHGRNQGENQGGCGRHKECDNNKKETDPEEEALNIKYMRLMADFQNYKRRTEKERLDTYAYANEKIVSELLNVIDNFERALDAGEDGDGFVEGMKLIFTQLQGVLEKSGVSEIKSLGEDFDPNFHSAVMTEDSTEYESGKVTGVLQKGYTLNGKVVRPAMVKVAN